MRAEDKEMLIEEIIGLLNSNAGNKSQTDSLRFSEDYDPRRTNLSQEEMEEIQFQFFDQDRDIQKPNHPTFKKTQQVPQEATASYAGPKREEVKPQQVTQSAVSRIRQKNSLKRGEVQIKKMTSKQYSNEFTKKYDSLFDEIFHQEKIKQEKIEKKEQKKEVSKDKIPERSQGQSKQVRKQFIQSKVNIEDQPKIIVSQEKKPNESDELHKKMQALKSSQEKILKSQQDIISKLSGNKNESKKAEKQSISSSEKLSDSIVIKHENANELPLSESERKKRKSSQNMNVNPIIENKRSLSQSSDSNVSDTTLGSNSSFAILPPVTRQSYEQFAEMYAHKPHLVEALKPKVQVTYSEKKQVEIKNVNKQLVPPAKKQETKLSPSKPAIKFSYGQIFTQPKSQQKIEKYATFTLKEQIRLPLFLRRLRQLTNNYPNFYTNKSFTKQNVDKWNTQLKEALQQCALAIKKLKIVHLRYHEMIKMVKELYQKMSKNITEKKSEEDEELVKYFLEKEWDKIQNFAQLEDIKPHDLFEKRVLNELEFMTLLNSYQEMIESTQTDEVLLIGVPMSVKTYMDLREKLWAIEKNLRIMSQDFYLKAVIKVHLPEHILHAHKIIKAGKAESVKEKNRDLDCLVFLRERKDVFALSWLGKKTISILEQK